MSVESVSIKKAEEYNDKKLKFLYELLISSCPDYTYLDIDDFKECRNSIYYINGPFYIDGIIGCRRMSEKEFNKDLLYHCTPENIVYSIEFLHYLSPYYSVDRIRTFVRECLADKNDAFCLLNPKCPTKTYESYKDILFNLGFYESNGTLIRHPILIPNKI